DSPEFLTRFKTFYLVGASIARPQTEEPSASGGRPTAAPTALSVESSRVQKTCVLVKLKGIDTVEQAQALRDRVLLIARDDPHIPAGTVFHADLIGLPVRSGGVEIGTIREILSMPASDVWIVKGEKEYMIPNVRAFVPAIDLTIGYVDVNLIEGMESDEN
ncbi:MAG: 16S rRNA processing protein RimM, partial [Oscillospiraceae bacterium]|nr:16S rRNA processing protein RimM [Oscillospiraceae bacterium]